MPPGHACLQHVNHFHHNRDHGGREEDDDEGELEDDNLPVQVQMLMFCQSAKPAVFDGSFLGGNSSYLVQGVCWNCLAEL